MKDSKKTKLTISSILKKMERYAINFDHPLQRSSGAWTSVMIGNLVSDILQDNPIPDLVFAEQQIHEAPITWGIDGKQRCTNIQAFYNNKCKISDKVTRYMIDYPVPVLDEDGNPLRDDEGIVIHERKVCDIRKKRFKDLPKELQERFLDYGFDIVLYLDCSEENIAYHITRYNESRPMNPAQKGMARLGVNFANMVRNIASMSFFEDAIGKYSNNQFKTGAINRVIIESVMTTSFLNDWTKDYSEMCEFLKSNACNEDFNNFKSLVERLEETLDEQTGSMFDAKNSMLWFGLFSNFAKLDVDDYRFNDFMSELYKGMYDVDGKIIKDIPMSGICTIEIDGITFEELLNNRATKDVKVVKERIDFLTQLLCVYLGVDMPNDEISDEMVEMGDVLDDFAQNFVSDEVAIKTLIVATDNTFTNFEPNTLNDAIRHFNSHLSPQDINDVLFYKSFVDDADIYAEDDNLPYYVYAAKLLIDSDIDIDISEWLSEFAQDAFYDIDNDVNNLSTSNSTLMLKQSVVIQNINKLTKGEINNESV